MTAVPARHNTRDAILLLYTYFGTEMFIDDVIVRIDLGNTDYRKNDMHKLKLITQITMLRLVVRYLIQSLGVTV
jgi:hypothetical protein